MTTTIDSTMATLLRSRLLELARQQDELAARQAAGSPYWMPEAPAIHGRRIAADVLRAEVDRLLDASSRRQ